jgi:hypothetical protein
MSPEAFFLPSDALSIRLVMNMGQAGVRPLIISGLEILQITFW